ncbi:MAG: glycosyltransferase family 2 protein [Lachnoclostridium sp.]|nr:glycosyltransferase family 2 protein [Lachnospira sp.]MCM1247765.1 glycosyltransferase family 2 protein [Lachnoclostridium sp.]MCM1534312.1 glycosyltransferase family 2 protein [Clostridium sp.]
MDIDVIIPIYKPDKTLFVLLDKLKSQTLPIHRIILLNTEEKYFERLTYGSRELERHKNLDVFHVSKREFDHGNTRRLGVKKSGSEIFVMMTQDAMPKDDMLLEKLIKHLGETAAGQVAVAYARQLPAEGCSVLERFTREFNYPAKSLLKSAESLPGMGIKTFFCSNVCAAYRRDIYEELGGFVKHTIFNEDMLYAAKAVKAGYAVAYEAEAQVIHSHNYTNGQQLRRNFDLGVSQAQHPEVFQGVSSESEGKKLVKAAVSYLKKNHKGRQLPYFYSQCFCKYLGYLLGKHYRMLPRRLILKLTSNKEYWLKDAAPVK